MTKKILIIIGLLLVGTILFLLVRPTVSYAPTTTTDSGQTKSLEAKKEPQIPSLSIESIFDDRVDIEGLDESKIIRLIATGDVIPARGANWPAVTSGDFTYNWRGDGCFFEKR